MRCRFAARVPRVVPWLLCAALAAPSTPAGEAAGANGGTGAASAAAPIAAPPPSADAFDGDGDVFRRVLALRDKPDPAAFPALAATMRRHRGSGNIFLYAAAQALFALDTPEAHAELEKTIAETPCGYQVLLAISYAPHWKMAPARAEAIHRRHHLKHTSKVFDFAVAAQVGADRRVVELSVTVANRTDSPRSMAGLKYLSDAVVLAEDMDSKRLLSPSNEMVRMCGPIPWMEPLAAHATQTVHLPMALNVLPGTGELTLDTGSCERPLIALGRGGRYRFWVVWESFALPEDRREADRQGDPPPRLFQRSVAVSNVVTLAKP